MRGIVIGAKRRLGRVQVDSVGLMFSFRREGPRWTDLPETFKTKTTVDGLTPATVYSFRLQTVTNNGPSEWSAPVTILAH